MIVYFYARWPFYNYFGTSIRYFMSVSSFDIRIRIRFIKLNEPFFSPSLIDVSITSIRLFVRSVFYFTSIDIDTRKYKSFKNELQDTTTSSF